ncbi:MAG: Lrp/AsnC family transcriptional regulator [Deltaproteobacteria bacterium]|nr:Lrp/AsnC family transcriptional regulator [Deltaproteobacteria bacterium]
MIDSINLEILKILQEKARIPNVDVARQIGMAPSAVLERIRKLESQKIIEGYEVRLNPKFFDSGLIAFITVKTDENADEIELGQKLARRPKVQEVHYVAGEDAFLVKLRGANTEEIGRQIRETIKSNQGVQLTKTSIVMATYKETAQFPIDNGDKTA